MTETENRHPVCFRKWGGCKLPASSCEFACAAYEEAKAAQIFRTDNADVEVSLKSNYAIFSPGDGSGFVIVAYKEKEGKVYYRYPADGGGSYTPDWIETRSDQIVAHGTNYNLLKSNMNAAMALEKLLRPAWQASIELEIRLRRDMQEAVWARAKGGLES